VILLKDKDGRFNSSEPGTWSSYPFPPSFPALALYNFPPMAPSFLRNLLPKKEKVERARPLWEVLAGLTLVQWGLFFSG